MLATMLIYLYLQVFIFLDVGVHETLQSSFLDDECGLTKNCFRVPSCSCSIDECDYYLQWNKVSDTEVSFVFSAKVSGDMPWAAFGLNDQPEMPGAGVIDCIVNGSQILIQASYNEDHSNLPLTRNKLGLVTGSLSGAHISGRNYCNFTRYVSVNKSDPESGKVKDLLSPYYVLFANGPTNNHGMKYKHKVDPFESEMRVDFLVEGFAGSGDGNGRSPFIKAHATVMIIAWMLFASLGIVTSRYLKKEWMNGLVLCGKPLWFQIHRTAILVTLALTLSGVLIIFKYSNWRFEPPELHPLLGIIVCGLLAINPVIGFLRPDVQSPKRPIFLWTHGLVGHSVHLLAVVTMFFGLRHHQAQMPEWACWIVIGFGVWRILIDIILSIMSCHDNAPFDYTAMADKEERLQDKFSSWRYAIVITYIVVTLGAALALIIAVNVNLSYPTTNLCKS